MSDTSELEAFFSRHLADNVRVRLIQNKRMLLQWARRDGVLTIEVNRAFTSAPTDVWRALALRVSGVRDLEAEALLDTFFQKHQSREARVRRASLQERLHPRGRWYDLSEIVSTLNDDLLDRRFRGFITWGRRPPRGRRRRTIRLGSYSMDERLIRIHPAMDQSFVPRYFVEWVVFHEMLHQLVPVKSGGGRRRFHTKQFRELEAAYPLHEQAKAWENANLKRLLES